MKKLRYSKIIALFMATGMLMTGCDVSDPSENTTTTAKTEETTTTPKVTEETTTPAETAETTTAPEKTEISLYTISPEINAEYDLSDSPFEELFTYTVFDDHVRIDKCLKFSSQYVIPEEIEGKKVTEIGQNCFSEMADTWFGDESAVQKVVLPDTIEVINDHAMSGVGAFTGTHINMPKNLKKIGNYAFYDCGWTDVTIPESVTEIGEYAFSGDGGMDTPDYLQLVRFEGNIETLPEGCFSDNEFLEYVYLPKNLNSIGKWCFRDCKKIKEIAIPDSVTTIEDYAFQSCNALENIAFSENLSNIGSQVFNDTPFLANNQPLIINEILVDYSSAKGDVVIPDNVSVVGKYAFYDNQLITSAVIPSGVDIIDEHAFGRCKELESVNISDTVTRIENSAFSNCVKLNNVVIPDSVTFIGSAAFNKCESLTDITIPETTTHIHGDAFERTPLLESNQPLIINNILVCYSADDEITEAVIPDGVTKISPYAFYSLKLTSITIPDCVKEIGDGAFYRCEYLTSVSLPSDIIIGEDVFKATPIEQDSSLIEYR